MSFWHIWDQANGCSGRKIVRSICMNWWNTVGQKIHRIGHTFQTSWPNWSRQINEFTWISTIWDQITYSHPRPRTCWPKANRMTKAVISYSHLSNRKMEIGMHPRAARNVWRSAERWFSICDIFIVEKKQIRKRNNTRARSTINMGRVGQKQCKIRII